MELPLLEPVYTKFQEEGFVIIAIDVRADTKNAVDFINEKGLTYPLVEGNVPMAVNDWKIQYTPSSFMIGPDGTVLGFKGEIKKSEIPALEAEIAEMLKK